jgi:hypothetical protein
MIPLSDDNPTMRTPVVTIALLVALGTVWVFVQGAGFDRERWRPASATSGSWPGRSPASRRWGPPSPWARVACVVDRQAVNG